MLTLRVRAPTNANSFSVQMYFLSAEYPEWVCTDFNDFFVTLVNSADNANPADGNIAIYDDGATTWPVGINLVDAGAGLFTQCTNGDTGQCIVGPGGGTYNGCTGTADLDGTGFDIVETVPAQACNYNGLTGGGTGWLTMSGNVVPGETFEIRFAIWDTGDGFYDSLVLLDDWQWELDASEPWGRAVLIAPAVERDRVRYSQVAKPRKRPTAAATMTPATAANCTSPPHADAPAPEPLQSANGAACHASRSPRFPGRR